MMNIFLDQLHDFLSFYSTTCNNFLSLGDFNISCDDKCFREFCNSFSFDHLIKTQTCYMGTYPSNIDYIITNMTSLFMKSHSVETVIVGRRSGEN